jgi:hypothetical protein
MKILKALERKGLQKNAGILEKYVEYFCSPKLGVFSPCSNAKVGLKHFTAEERCGQEFRLAGSRWNLDLLLMGQKSTQRRG